MITLFPWIKVVYNKSRIQHFVLNDFSYLKEDINLHNNVKIQETPDEENCIVVNQT